MPKPRPVLAKAHWPLQDAKNRFSEVVNAALRGQPQIVTRRGVETAVVIAHEDYARIVAPRAKRPPLSAYLLSGTPSAAGEPFERIRLRARSEV